jgi:hypothetical protein
MDVDLSGQLGSTERASISPTLSAQQFYQHDPLIVLLKNKLHLHNHWIIAGSILLSSTLCLMWWLRMRDVLINKAPFWGLNDTLGALLQTFVVFPLLFAIYLLLPSTIAGLFNTLSANGIIGESRKDRPGTETYEHFLQKLVSWTDKEWWAAGALMIVVVYFLCRVLLVELHIKPQPLAPFWLRVASLIIFSPLMYATFVSVMRLLFTLIFTNWLFYEFTILVKPLHLDGSGGLGALGRILWVSVIIMLWDALLLSAALLSGNISLFSPLELILIGAIYVALAPSLLIGWLLLPHRVMLKARDAALRPLADQFQQALVEIMPSPNDNAEVIKAGTDRLSELKHRYDLMRDLFPTWPLEIQEFGRLVATLSLPALLPLLLPLLLQVISFITQTFAHPPR